VSDGHERYQAEAMPKKAKNPHEYKKQIRSGVQKLLPVFDATPTVNITRPELRRFCDRWLLEGKEPATLNWVLSGLSAVWRWSQEVGLLSDSLTCPVRWECGSQDSSADWRAGFSWWEAA